MLANQRNKLTMELYLSERDIENIRKLQRMSKIWKYEVRDNITIEGCGKKVKAWDEINNQECIIKNLPK